MSTLENKESSTLAPTKLKKSNNGEKLCSIVHFL